MHKSVLNPYSKREVDSILTAISDRYGYDFSGYHQDVIARRIAYVMEHLNLSSLAELEKSVYINEEVFQCLLSNLTVDVSCMFRDTESFLYLRNEVLPRLKSLPFIRVWVAGCASGQDAFSMAILLKEEGFEDRSIVYATDINKISLNRAKNGVYSIEDIRKYSQHYLESGGDYSLSDYLTIGSRSARVKREIRNNILFSNHNLVTDSIFNQFDIIMCSNVMIYFERPLKNRVLRLLTDSLNSFGHLVIGRNESLMGTAVYEEYTLEKSGINIYKKKGHRCKLNH